MTIHNFTPPQEKMFASVTNKPTISVRIATWHDDPVNETRTYVLLNGQTIELPSHAPNTFYHAKKKLLYLPLYGDYLDLLDRVVERYKKELDEE